MTAPTNTVVSVVTTDKDPALAEYRISAVVGKDTASVTINLNPGNAPLRPGVGVRPGIGVLPGGGGFDVGEAMPGEDLTPDMVPYVAAYRMIPRPPGGKGVNSRTYEYPVANLGCVCGIDRCGRPGVMPLRMEAKRVSGGPKTATPDITTPVSYSELAPAGDGDVTIDVFALIEPEGWI